MEECKYKAPSGIIDKAPWLIVTHSNNKKGVVVDKQSFYSMSDNKRYVKSIVDLDGKSIVGSCFGWLVLRQRNNVGMFSLWNPATSQCLRLPALEDAPEQLPCCAFTSSPVTDSTDAADVCLVVLCFEGLVCFCCPTVGEEYCRWFRHRLENQDEDKARVQVIHAVTLDGLIYAYARYTNKNDNSLVYMFARFRVAKDDHKTYSYSISFEPFLSESPIDSINFLVYPRWQEYVVEVLGSLYLVHLMLRQVDDLYNYDIFKVFIWRLDMPSMKWIRVKSLGGCAFLLSCHVSTWCYAGDFFQGDSIYLVAKGTHTMHSYSLRDDHSSFLSPHPSFNWCLDAPIWFIPPNYISKFIDRFSPIILEETREINEEITHAEDTNTEMYEERLSRNLLTELHEDVKTSIANHMHLVDYLNLCVAYKNFDPNMTLAKWLTDRSSPLLASLKSNNHMCELWDPRENLRHRFNTPNLADHLTTINFCNNGWLLLQVEGDSLQYLNPITREFGTYPYNNEMIQGSTSYAFSTYPTSSDCITVGIDGCNDVIINCFETAKNEWTYHSFGHYPDEGDVEFWANYNSNPLYYDGAFYFLDMKGNLGIFEMFEGETYWDVHRSPLNEEERLTLYSCYLVELNGQLTSVFFHNLGKTVRVFKFEVVTQEWHELHDLGEYVLYLSLASSFSTFEKDIDKRNRIYLTRYVGDKIVYYSLVTRKYHTLGNEDTMKDLYGTSCQPYCCWI